MDQWETQKSEGNYAGWFRPVQADLRSKQTCRKVGITATLTASEKANPTGLVSSYVMRRGFLSQSSARPNGQMPRPAGCAVYVQGWRHLYNQHDKQKVLQRCPGRARGSEATRLSTLVQVPPAQRLTNETGLSLCCLLLQ